VIATQQLLPWKTTAGIPPIFIPFIACKFPCSQQTFLCLHHLIYFPFSIK
jgi:hypothetical protein